MADHPRCPVGQLLLAASVTLYTPYHVHSTEGEVLIPHSMGRKVLKFESIPPCEILSGKRCIENAHLALQANLLA